MDTPLVTLKDQSAFGFMGELPRAETLYRVGLVGATGLVGRTLLRVLARRRFAISELHLYASTGSEGKEIDTPYGKLPIEVLDVKNPPRLDIAFMAAGSEVARFWGWRLAHRGAVVIDKSSYFRDKDYAPLVVPEVNGDRIKHHRGIIANPNCTTIPLTMTLYPLHKAFGLRRVTVVSFQSVSGHGKDGMVALETELGDPEADTSVFPKRIAYNVIPWIGEHLGAFSGEEAKLVSETRKIMRMRRLAVRGTAVRVPTLVGHALAVHADFWRRATADAARKVLSEFPGITVIDTPDSDEYPTPLDAAGRDEVLVGRIRNDRGRRGLAYWIVTDNLRKGAATNAVQIAEVVIGKQPGADAK